MIISTGCGNPEPNSEESAHISDKKKRNFKNIKDEEKDKDDSDHNKRINDISNIVNVLGLGNKSSGEVGGSSDIFQIFKASEIKQTFDNVIGLEKAKESLKVLLKYLQDPDQFTKRFGAEPWNGVLLYGPPGTGKTQLARSLAGEVAKVRDITFIVTSGSHFDNKYVGVGADNVRKLFNLAELLAPCIIFIDEIESLAGTRTDDNKNAQTVTAFLNGLDGFKGRKDIFVIGATNHLDRIDPAVRRPGRIDRKIQIKLPSDADRKKIIEYYFTHSDYKITGIDVSWLVKQTKNWSPAELKAMINAARTNATMHEPPKNKIDKNDFIDAIAIVEAGRDGNH